MVWLINHGQAHVDAMNKRGLTLRAAGVDRNIKVSAVTRCSHVDLSSDSLDLLIVLVKSFDTQAAIQTAIPLLGKQTVVLSLQNGLGNEQALEAALMNTMGAGNVIAGRTYAGGFVLAPGLVVDGTRGKHTVIGELGGGLSPRCQAIAQAFTQAGLTTEVSSNIMTDIWDKLLVNAASGALSTITGLPYGPLYEQPALQAVGMAVVAEGMAVAKACGVSTRFSDPSEPWYRAGAGLPRDFKPSMLQSLEKGSITEIDVINGAIVEQGKRYAVPTPVNATLVACVKALESKLTVNFIESPS
jgi:2-dehydropantoate 2-reductase